MLSAMLKGNRRLELLDVRDNHLLVSTLVLLEALGQVPCSTHHQRIDVVFVLVAHCHVIPEIATMAIRTRVK